MQYLFLDESGNLHKNSPDKYFVIGGVFTNNYADIKKSYVEINHDLKEKLNMDFDTELKAAYLNMEEKMDIVVKLQKMNGMYIVGIVVDKEKIGIEIDEIHLYYNYIIRKLLDYLIKIKLIFYITKIFTICLAFVTIVFLFKKNLKYNFNFVKKK